MKCTTVTDKSREEEVIIYTHGESALAARIEALVREASAEYVGYSGKDIVIYKPEDVTCFFTEGGKVYAITDTEKLEVKERIYTLLERLGTDFVKINQSCIANIKKIKLFNASISGTLLVIFKNGHRDYVSRRQMKAVKERLGIR